MQIREELRIGRPADEVWAAITDPDVVFACVPGGRAEGRGDGGAFLGSLVVDAGPTRLELSGSLAAAVTGPRRAIAELRAEDRGGMGRVRGTIEVTVEDRGLFSMILLAADLTLSGSVAGAGRSGLLTEAANEIAVAFAECLERRIGPPVGPVSADIGDIVPPEGDRPGLLARLLRILRTGR